MDFLIRYRNRLNISQRELAIRLGVSASTLNHIETDHRQVPAELAIKWSQIIRGWSVFDLRPDLKISKKKGTQNENEPQ